MKPVVVRFPSRLTSSRAFRYNSTPFGGRPSGAAFLFCGVRAPTSGSRTLEPVQGVGQVNTAHATSAIVPTYARANVAFERGEGCWLVSTEGERYLDFGAGRSADEPGLEAVARFEPVSESRGRTLCAPSGRRHLRRPRVLRQFGRRGQRGGGEDGAPAPVD
jgi:hypothetical protein